MPLTKVQSRGTENVGQGSSNVIINGGMTISQRGTSFTNPSSNAYCLDRYAIQWTGISPQFTVSQDTSVPNGEGFYNSLKIATSNTQTPSGGQGAYMYQKVEGANFFSSYGTSDALTMTLSFYVKSSKTGTYSVGFHNNAFDRNLLSEYTISSANTWEKKTITFVGDTSGTWVTDNTIGLGVYFHLSNGDGSNTTTTMDSWQTGNYYLGSQNQVNLWDSSSATWFLTGVQLEVGSQASDFQHEDRGITLYKCERYYQQIGGYTDAYTRLSAPTVVGSTQANWTFPFKTIMRATPSLTATASNWILTNGSGSKTLTSLGLTRSDVTQAFLVMQWSGTEFGVGQSVEGYANNDTSYRMQFDSEL